MCTVTLGLNCGTFLKDLPGMYIFPLSYFLFLVELGFELRAYCLQGRCSTTFCTGYFEIGSSFMAGPA
jgi:hypothetical protein